MSLVEPCRPIRGKGVTGAAVAEVGGVLVSRLPRPAPEMASPTGRQSGTRPKEGLFYGEGCGTAHSIFGFTPR